MLHEYLEKKRRDSVSLYNASGACHICGSSCRNKRGFSHAIECAATSSSSPGSGGCVLSDRVHSDGYGDGDSMVPRADRSVMRVCSCFDQEADDPDYSPYSIRVCEMCIRNDVNIGRIIHCGMCGVVACDEDCGPVMYECTGEFPSLRDLEAGPALFRPRRGHFSRAARRRRKALKQGPFVLYHFFLHFIFLPKHYRLFLSKTMRSGTTPDASIAAPSPTSLSSRSSAAAPQMASHAPPASASRAYQPSRRGSATTSNAAIFAAGGGWCRVTSWS